MLLKSTSNVKIVMPVLLGLVLSAPVMAVERDIRLTRDEREDIRDLREDVRDSREDIRDRREDIRDRREDISDRSEDRRDALR